MERTNSPLQYKKYMMKVLATTETQMDEVTIQYPEFVDILRNEAADLYKITLAYSEIRGAVEKVDSVEIGGLKTNTQTGHTES